MNTSSAQLNDVLQLVDDFYDAATLSSDWNRALGGLERLFPMAGVIFERHDVRGGGLLAFESSGLPEQGLEEWQNYYHSICPRVRYILDQPVGTIGYDLKVLSKREMDRHPLYQDFLRKYGVFYFLSATLERDSHRFTSVSMQRTSKQGHAKKEEIELLGLLTPHLQNALRVDRCLRSAIRQVDQLQSSLHCLTSGVMIVDQHARVEFMNESAEEVVKRNEGIQLKRSALSFTPPGLQAMFTRAISELASVLGNAGGLAGYLPADSTRPCPMRVDFLKLPPRATLSTAVSVNRGPAPRLLIVLNAPARDRSMAPLLRDCFNLTPMEARLAVALADGTRLKEYAEEHGLSITTVRTHLVNLRRKMGAGTQSDVVSMVWQLHGAVC